MFYVGQKVVCIGHPKNPRCALYPSAQIPRVGGIYVIRAINVWPDSTKLRFVGLDNRHLTEPMGGNIEPGFNSKFFRPVVERKTDISIFTEILRKVTKKAPAKPKKFETASWWS